MTVQEKCARQKEGRKPHRQHSLWGHSSHGRGPRQSGILSEMSRQQYLVIVILCLWSCKCRISGQSVCGWLAFLGHRAPYFILTSTDKRIKNAGGKRWEKEIGYHFQCFNFSMCRSATERHRVTWAASFKSQQWNVRQIWTNFKSFNTVCKRAWAVHHGRQREFIFFTKRTK